MLTYPVEYRDSFKFGWSLHIYKLLHALCMRAVNALARLHKFEGSSTISLLAYVIRSKIACTDIINCLMG